MTTLFIDCRLRVLTMEIIIGSDDATDVKVVTQDRRYFIVSTIKRRYSIAFCEGHYKFRNIIYNFVVY